MGQDLMIADTFKKVAPSAVFAGLDPREENLADGIGVSYAVIGYKGKVWTLRRGGETHTFVRADDQSPLNYIDVVILRSAEQKSKSYYDGFEEGETGKRPICASLDGIKPDSDATVKQAEACAICPRNEWKTNDKGKKEKDCSDFKRLAVLVLPKMTAALLGQPLMEPAFLRIPPASLGELATFGDTMSGLGYHFSVFVTRISFDPEAAHPKFKYKAIKVLSDEEAKVVMDMRNEASAKRITGEDQVRVTTVVVPTKPVQQVAPASQPKVIEGTVESKVVEIRPPEKKAEAKKPEPEPEEIDTGFGAVGKPAEKPAAAVAAADFNKGAAVGQTAEDVGEVGPASSALDERIAKLLQS